MTDVEKARIALREAQIAEEIQKHAKERNEFGVCPKGWGHFDGACFFIGVMVGAAHAVLAVLIITTVTHAAGCH